MLRKIGFGLLCMAASLNTHAYSLENNEIQARAITVEYEFLPNQPLVLANYMFWTINANCIITTENSSAPLNVIALAKKGKINDIPVTAGDSMQVPVFNGETLRLSADSGARVEITNLGELTVKASCTTS
ncbi:hypothetical protein J2N86_11760 [Legionella lytica]|uniref:Uncharacterized protein n=1 Tax=Legionella lytica TaxID=96232 RepID=A0ABY4Y6W1_9GAMM|nr:hypothetical protein [Legionella lytica]USQ13353.1 hypothetical protein J2N86_11760 [Legionella lytica]